MNEIVSVSVRRDKWGTEVFFERMNSERNYTITLESSDRLDRLINISGLLKFSEIVTSPFITHIYFEPTDKYYGK